jgi:aspartoacylase
MSDPVRTVAIVGGTHGNEITGPHLLRHWRDHPDEVTRPGIETTLVLGNPKAFEANRRYIDDDLNRVFGIDALRDDASPSYEATRAAVLDSRLGPKGAPKTDLLIDLHTSTSHCGAMIILLDTDPFSVRMAAWLSGRIPQVRVHHIPVASGDQPYLGSVARRCLGVELGPVPQGTLRHDVYELSRTVVLAALDFVVASNARAPMTLPESVEVFRFCETVPFPADGPYKLAMVHESLLGRDYAPLAPGEPLFRRLDGSVVPFEGPETRYPVFIDEAAYYERDIAMMLTTKERLPVPEAV